MKRLLILPLLILLSACGHLPPPGSWPPPTQTPAATPTATPSPSATPGPDVQVRQFVRGRAILDVEGLADVEKRLGKGRDDLVLAVLTWETTGEDRTKPILGIHIRGRAKPEDKPGFLLRWSPNLDHDHEVYDRFKEHRPDLFAGGGQNYHLRKPYGSDGQWIIVWTDHEIRVTAPSGEMQRLPLRCPKSAGFGRLVTELWPRPRRGESRYHLWAGFEAGARVRVLEWTGEAGELQPCRPLDALLQAAAWCPGKVHSRAVSPQLRGRPCSCVRVC